ncbi:MAG TPA: purine-nucleoside phosphorylase [Cyclobacteriaceae bacterium]
MSNLKEKINETTSFLTQKGIKKPEISIILGTGLGQLAESIEPEVQIEYDEVPHFPASTVEYHHGKLIYGNLEGKKVLAMQGRFHYYEGYSMQEITFPVRVMKQMGVKYLLISNAAGAINLNWEKGELMLLDDHINLQPENPLTGINDNALGPRFPDMSQPYSKALNDQLKAIAQKRKIKLNEGVYVAVSGPNLETRAEYRYLGIIGADAVGMSTVPEVIVANHMSLPCAAISVLTDACDPDNLQPVDISEIIAVAKTAEKDLTLLYKELVRLL